MYWVKLSYAFVPVFLTKLRYPMMSWDFLIFEVDTVE
jgi:hypothetical protein